MTTIETIEEHLPTTITTLFEETEEGRKKAKEFLIEKGRLKDYLADLYSAEVLVKLANYYIKLLNTDARFKKLANGE